MEFVGYRTPEYWTSKVANSLDISCGTDSACWQSDRCNRLRMFGIVSLSSSLHTLLPWKRGILLFCFFRYAVFVLAAVRRSWFDTRCVQLSGIFAMLLFRRVCELRKRTGKFGSIFGSRNGICFVRKSQREAGFRNFRVQGGNCGAALLPDGEESVSTCSAVCARKYVKDLQIARLPWFISVKDSDVHQKWMHAFFCKENVI